MSAITTHVLDAVLGKPAAGISVRLEKREGGGWSAIASGMTDADGRCRGLAPDAAQGTYLAGIGRTSIYPEIAITFNSNGREHYHLPLLLSDNSYTTYRGS